MTLTTLAESPYTSIWIAFIAFPRGTMSPNHLGDQLLQLSVEQAGNFRHLHVPELPEQRGRLAVAAGRPVRRCHGEQAFGGSDLWFSGVVVGAVPDHAGLR